MATSLLGWFVEILLISLLSIAAIVVGCKKKKPREVGLRTGIDVREPEWEKEYENGYLKDPMTSVPMSFEAWKRVQRIDEEYSRRIAKDRAKWKKEKEQRIEEINKGALRPANNAETIGDAKNDFKMFPQAEIIGGDKTVTQADATGVTQGDQTGAQADGVVDGKKSNKDSKKSQKTGTISRVGK